MSTSEDRTSSMFSVHWTESGSQSTFFRATLRFRMCVRRRWVFERSQRILATELPTVPKPSKATSQVCAPSFCAPTFCVPTTALFLVESSLEVPGIPSLAGKPIFPVAFYYRRSGHRRWCNCLLKQQECARELGRPSGTRVVIPLYPALKRGAKLGRPSGAGFSVRVGWKRLRAQTFPVRGSEGVSGRL